VLRLIKPSDLKNIHELHSLPETDKYNTLGIPKDIAETKGILETWIQENSLLEIKNYNFVIEQKLNKEFIGLFGFKIESKNLSSIIIYSFRFS
jgi:ribosomal-protein-alanine N-acetyltransferase